MDKIIFNEIVTTLYGTPIQIFNVTVIKPLDFESNNFKFIKQLGQGAYATISLIRHIDTGREFAVRKSPPNNRQTVGVQPLLSNYKMAPDIYYSGTIKQGNNLYTISIMDVIIGTLDFARKHFDIKKLIQAMECLLDKKYLLKFLHGDMHFENIVILKDGITLGFIDFDFSYINVPYKYTVLDFIPLIGSLIKSKIKYYMELATLIKSYYKEKFNITIMDSLFVEKDDIGGYFYSQSNLNSYLLLDIGKQSVSSFDRVFTTFRLPKITP